MEPQHKVEFSKIRQLLTIGELLSHYGLKAKRISNTEMKCDCPLESHKAASKDHQKDTFKFGIDKKTGAEKWFCHSDSCRKASNSPHGGDVIDLVRILENLGDKHLDAAKKLVEWYPHLNGSKDKPQNPNNGSDDVKVLPPSKPLTNPPLAWTLQGVIPAHEAIQSKGISVETAVKFNVGYFPGAGSMKNRVVFPLYEDGHLIGYAGRTVLEITDDNPKWRLPKGLHFTFLYGLERCDPSKMLVLCESPWGVLHFYQHSQQAAALIGTHLTEEQEARLEPYKTICIAMDNDAPGREAAAKLAERLKPGRKIWKAFLEE